MAERRLPQDEKEQESDRRQKKVDTQKVLSKKRWRNEAEHEADQRQKECGDGAQVRERILEMMTGEQLAQPLLHAVGGQR